MRERGLPLSPMMARATVRAVSPKTMTRRLVNPQPLKAIGSYRGVPLELMDSDWAWTNPKTPSATTISNRSNGPVGWEKHCPYGIHGDRLYGREAWRTLSKYDSLPPHDVPTTAPIWYEADGRAPPEFGRYRHGRFMVRWMARIVREVTSVAVERLSSISEADAMREGIEREDGVVVGAECYGGHHHEITATRYFIPGLHEEQEQPALNEVSGFAYATSAFFRLWEILHGPGSVEADPWLWVIGLGPVPVP